MFFYILKPIVGIFPTLNVNCAKYADLIIELADFLSAIESDLHV